MLLSEKLLEDAKAAIDEARQYADEINRLGQRVQELEHSLNEMAHGKAEEAAKRQQVEGELQHLKAENTSLADTLTKETSRATSLQHEVDRLRQKIVGSKTDEGNARPHSEERVAKLEVEVDKLKRSLEHLWRIESRQEDNRGGDEEGQPVKRWVTWRSMAWLCATALGGWLTAIYLGLLK
jgi:chromosome segregation ATPase